MSGQHTSGPWETSRHQNLKTVGNPNHWTARQHEFPDYPYEGQLEEEWGVYPPLGERGPVALVAGPDNARLIAAAPALLEAAHDALAAYGPWTGKTTKQEDACDALRAAITAATQPASIEDR